MINELRLFDSDRDYDPAGVKAIEQSLEDLLKLTKQREDYIAYSTTKKLDSNFSVDNVIKELKDKAMQVGTLLNERKTGLNFQDQIYATINEFFQLGYDFLFETRYVLDDSKQAGAEEEIENATEEERDVDLETKKAILQAFSDDDLLRQFISLFDLYLKEEMNTKVQMDILMRIKSSHRFGDFANPANKLIIENYFDEILGVRAAPAK